MKISELIKREPFDRIFIETFTLFLDEVFGKSHIVEWKRKSLTNSILMQQWYCNPLINSIFVKKVNPNVFRSINGEYLDNPLKPWRSLLQKLYLHLSQNHITSQFFAKYKIEISPPLEDPSNKLIIGGNTKIRMIDISKNIVYVILKNGFDKKFIDKEIYIREKFINLPVTKIIKQSQNALWFCEEYIHGISPNRMHADKGKETLQNVVERLNEMLIETRKKVSLAKYTFRLENEIDVAVKKLVFVENNVKERIVKIKRALIELLDDYMEMKVTIAYCHGDFHQGNILANAKKFWILDWENSGEKQISYDLLILLLESRNVDGYIRRLNKIIQNDLTKDQIKLIDNWPGIDFRNGNLKKINLVLFLLEELNFYVSETTNSLFIKDSGQINSRLKIFEEALNLTYFQKF